MKEPASIAVADVIGILTRWRDCYPADIFPESSQSPEAKAAKLARKVCDGIAQDMLDRARTQATELSP